MQTRLCRCGALLVAATPLLALGQQADSRLDVAVDQLASGPANPQEFGALAESIPAEVVIAALDDRLRNDPAFAPGERARLFAYQALLEVSEFDERGIRRYTDPRQIRLFIEALTHPGSGPASDILRIAHLVDEQYVGRVVPAIESIFSVENGPHSVAMQALGLIGPAARSALPVLQLVLVDPQSVNPRMTLDPAERKKYMEDYIESSIPEGWREEYRKFLENPTAHAQWGWVTPEQSIIRFRSAAALARLRIDVSLVPDDLALYQTLDPLGQRAGALALVGIATETRGVFDGSPVTSAAVAGFLADVYGRDDARSSRMETVYVFGWVLSSDTTPATVKRAWRDALVRLLVGADPEFNRIATQMLGG
ncbi:MAG: hypothetical protein D6693_01650 [Planctomycetota bacterium]|nr:MAG: hypothetical protein D6693_01650 [Planctomycetota bacterium]